MAGTLTAELLKSKRDVNGTTFQEAANKAGYGSFSPEVLIQLVHLIYLLAYFWKPGLLFVY